MTKGFKLFTAATIAVSAVTPVVNASAATQFSDVTEKNTHYTAIQSLVERGYISGYADGTYRPNATLTRGQAAKILANVLKLDTSDTTQKFSDVVSTNGYAGAINALAKANIISGYTDGTFKPNAPLTRGQMAKIIVKAFKLEEATEIKYAFTDIADNSGYKHYIQTLINYGVTTGTSDTTYSPGETVKRGQMASFVIRAEKAVTPTIPEQGGTTGGNTTGGSTGGATDGGNTTGGSTGGATDGGNTTGGSTGGATDGGNTGGATDGGNTGGTTDGGNTGGATDGDNTEGGSTAEDNTTVVNEQGAISALAGNKIKIGSKEYTIAAPLVKFFEGNEAALEQAIISVEVKDKEVVALTGLTLNDVAQFDGHGYTIGGDLSIKSSKENVTVKNLQVSGDVNVDPNVQSIAFDKVEIKGELTTAKVTAPQVRNSMRGSVQATAATTNQTRIQITFTDSTVAYLSITAPSNIAFHGGFTTKQVSVSADANIEASKDIILPELIIAGGVAQLKLNATIASVVVESDASVVLTGSGNFKEVTVKSDKQVTLNTVGTIGTLASNSAAIEMGKDVKFGQTKNLAGDEVAAGKLIQNIADVPKENVNAQFVQEEFVKYIAASAQPIYDKYGYVTLKVVNAEGGTIKYRQVASNRNLNSSTVKVGETAPTDAKEYKEGEQFIRWENADIEVYKVDKDNKVIDSYVVDRHAGNSHEPVKVTKKNDTLIIQTLVNPELHLKSSPEAFAFKSLAVFDGETVEYIEPTTSWAKNEEGIVELHLPLPEKMKGKNKDIIATVNTNSVSVVTDVPVTGGDMDYTLFKQQMFDMIKPYVNLDVEEKNYNSTLSLLLRNTLEEPIKNPETGEYEYKQYVSNEYYISKHYNQLIKESDYSTVKDLREILQKFNEKMLGQLEQVQQAKQQLVSLFKPDYEQRQGLDKLVDGVKYEQIQAVKKEIDSLDQETLSMLNIYHLYNVELKSIVSRYFENKELFAKVEALVAQYEQLNKAEYLEEDFTMLEHYYEQAKQDLVSDYVQADFVKGNVESFEKALSKLQKVSPAAVEAVKLVSKEEENGDNFYTFEVTFSEAVNLSEEDHANLFFVEEEISRSAHVVENEVFSNTLKITFNTDTILGDTAIALDVFGIVDEENRKVIIERVPVQY